MGPSNSGEIPHGSSKTKEEKEEEEGGVEGEEEEGKGQCPFDLFYLSLHQV